MFCSEINMIKFDDVTKENIKEHNPNEPRVPGNN